MLRKRTRLLQKDQQMGQLAPDFGSETNLQPNGSVQRQKTNSLFNVSGVLVGMTPMAASDYDSVKSPTSPLDFKLFTNLGNSLRFPKSSKCWDSNKVGLSIVDSDCVGEVMNSSNSKSILFGPQIRPKTPNSESLPKTYLVSRPTRSMSSNLQNGKSDVLFEICAGDDALEPDPFCRIQSFSLDSRRVGSFIEHMTERKGSFVAKSSGLGNGTAQVSFGSNNAFVRSLSSSEIELSEDYTCVIMRGPNPKTTHIFGDCILESHSGCRKDCGKNRESVVVGTPVAEDCSDFPNPYPLNDFLSFCYFCKKKLDEGKDIYMYRGEKAFCSMDCRYEEIRIEEGEEKAANPTPDESHQPENGDQIFELFVSM